MEFDLWIKGGDIIEIEAEGIGVLRNRVVRDIVQLMIGRGRYLGQVE